MNKRTNRAGVDKGETIIESSPNRSSSNRNLFSFEPIVDKSSKVLILGTLPGPESLRLGQYYAYTNNQFWVILYNVFEETVAAAAYSKKLSFLHKHEIALWDVFYSAERQGALDAAIKNEVPNDIPGLITAYPNITRILLNGRKAEKTFRIYCPNININAVYVPSTSPAYAKMSLEDKVRTWRAALTA